MGSQAVTSSYEFYTVNGGTLDGLIKGINDLIYPPVYQQDLMIGKNHYLSYPNGSIVSATIYRNATDPTYDQLIDFLMQDDTEQATYIPDQYVCIDFAVHLADNAERNGIKAHVVSVMLSGQSDLHAANAFNTTDRGWIYVDDTGQIAEEKAIGVPATDCTVEMKIGNQYLPVSITPTGDWTRNPMGIILGYTLAD